ncbi:cell wall-active antibiotics response protein LiaF [Cohnella herbarum]|uniref:Cell wall-active antibiotics response protein n=1 Tax=Cohnella herbarum TaxID=2728023 RepID=A0A7Z2VJZ4_9BACL|nr:cell wall-active antibiotics response protein LiaF [Cohnella herbarum]QJD84269.1 cell wall-active antibiotics response protein [Cohnella herbarum]
MRKPSNAILFIAAGIYLALGAVAGYTTVNAVILLLIGIERYRTDRAHISIVVIVISTLVLIITQFALLVVVVLISLGIYYFRAKPPTFGAYVSKHRLFLNMRLDEQSWVLQSMSYWHAIGEVRMDMSQAVPEEKETTIVLQGLVGDLDILVPDDYGIEVEASVLIGQVSFKQIKEGGMFHRLSWKSPNYDDCEMRLKLQLFYLVGDIKLRTV